MLHTCLPITHTHTLTLSLPPSSPALSLFLRFFDASVQQFFRYTMSEMFTGKIPSPFANVRQIVGDTHDCSAVFVGTQTKVVRVPYPRVAGEDWAVSVTGGFGGVAQWGERLYVLPYRSSECIVLAKQTGDRVGSFHLDPGSGGDVFGDLTGGLFVVGSKLFHGSTYAAGMYRCVIFFFFLGGGGGSHGRLL